MPALRVIAGCMIAFGICVKPSLVGLLVVVAGVVLALLVEIGRVLRDLGR